MPPVAAQIEHVEDRHGAVASDPYHWLREKTNPRVIEYLEAENAYTAEMTLGQAGLRETLYAEMLGRIQQTDVSAPVPRADYLYYTRTEEGRQYPIQCRRRGSMNAREEVLLDLNELAAGQPYAGLGDFQLSDDQNLLAYTIDYAGFRQYSLRVKDLRSGETLADTTERVTSVAWAADNRTLFLVTEDEVTKRSDRLLRHELGEPAFPLIHAEPDELYDLSLQKSRDARYLFLLSEAKDTTEVLFLSAGLPVDAFKRFLAREKGHRYYVDHREGLFYIRTNRTGRNFALMTAPPDDPRPENWQEFLAHRDDVRLRELHLFRNFAVSVERSGALDHARVYDFRRQVWSAIGFPEPVYSMSPGDTPDYDSSVWRYQYQSLVTPSSVFDYDVEAGASVLRKQQPVAGYDPAKYATERLWATARDGVRVPLSIVYKRDFPRDGTGPLLLYGYGSYGIGMQATFSSPRVSLLDRGMAYAIAHIRGGDELGEQWREAGMLMKKKNTFFDFIDCADFLIAGQWTSKHRLAIEGGSAGGLLTGAVVNLRPGLFRAVHMAVPFVDVVNTMLDATLPLTVGEYLEWGNPHEKAAFDYMLSYSPYDNLRQGDYPAILVTTSFNDSQVMYWEPAKYVARLRTLKTDSNPLLLKIKMEPAGHGGASGRYDRLRDTAFEYSWLLNEVTGPALTESES